MLWDFSTAGDDIYLFSTHFIYMFKLCGCTLVVMKFNLIFLVGHLSFGFWWTSFQLWQYVLWLLKEILNNVCRHNSVSGQLICAWCFFCTIMSRDEISIHISCSCKYTFVWFNWIIIYFTCVITFNLVYNHCSFSLISNYIRWTLTDHELNIFF